jgi:hypothetical protein
MNKIEKETWYFVCIDNNPLFAAYSRRTAEEIGQKLYPAGGYTIEEVIISEVKNE